MARLFSIDTYLAFALASGGPQRSGIRRWDGRMNRLAIRDYHSAGAAAGAGCASAGEGPLRAHARRLRRHLQIYWRPHEPSLLDGAMLPRDSKATTANLKLHAVSAAD